MKIKNMRIAGFRGIPPVSPPIIDIDLSSSVGGLKNLLLFGPNAYGKSSIANALEWFFKDSNRYRTYFEEYCDRDNIHLMVGENGFEAEAYVEITIDHNGDEYTLKKVINSTGEKTFEYLDSCPFDFELLKNEIIVLDHDQFRKFINEANADKWTTFSSLIGYEELEHFRSGIESLSSKSLTDCLRFNQLKKDITQKRDNFEKDKNQIISKYDIPGDQLQDIKIYFKTKLELTLSSLKLQIPDMEHDISSKYWEELRNKINISNELSIESTRLSELNMLFDKLVAFPDEFQSDLNDLKSVINGLNLKKDNFDKKILFDFYRMGQQIMDEKVSIPNTCPFCGTKFLWVSLYTHILNQQDNLNFSEIENQNNILFSIWKKIKQNILERRVSFIDIKLSNIKEAFHLIKDTTSVEKAISLETFNADIILTWVENVHMLVFLVEEERIKVENEIKKLKLAINNNPIAELQRKIEDLFSLWNSLQNLTNDENELYELERKKDVVEQVIELLRNATSRFRTELNDFSGRVVEIINKDVNKYYCELHPDEKIKPYLDVVISGNQRIVSMRCEYQGIPNKAALSLLSESHRNSLGMAIMLAFMKYKRQTGSPVGFCVFDDVTQSFDNEHRSNLLVLLENQEYPEISDQQIIFMTHDRTLADMVKRPGEQNYRRNWLRVDIKNWWLERIVLESEFSSDPLQKAQDYIDNNDEIAAGIYVRRALEQIYKAIIKHAKTRVQYSDKPWNVGMEDYRNFILDEITELWNSGNGFIDPNETIFQSLFTSQRILNLTVHDSHFLDNPMTLGDVRTALRLVQQLKARFSCQNCNKYYHTVRKIGGNIPQCKNQGCNNQFV